MTLIRKTIEDTLTYEYLKDTGHSYITKFKCWVKTKLEDDPRLPAYIKKAHLIYKYSGRTWYEIYVTLSENQLTTYSLCGIFGNPADHYSGLGPSTGIVFKSSMIVGQFTIKKLNPKLVP